MYTCMYGEHEGMKRSGTERTGGRERERERERGRV